MTLPRLVSVGRGRDLISEIAEASSGIEGWVQATGAVEGVEIRLAGEGANPVRAPRGRFSLVHLAGASGGPYGVTLARASDSGAEVWAGELVRATSDGVTLFIQPCSHSRALVEPFVPAPEAKAAPAPVASTPKASPSASSPNNGPATPVPGDWAKAALASAVLRRAAEAEHEPLVPEPGDLVEHFAFGLCEVLMGDDERLKIRDVNGPGRVREIRLDMLRVAGPDERSGKRLFRLARRS